MTVTLFEDERVDSLYPVTIGRPAYTINCGSFRLLDLAARLGSPLRYVVREHLREVQAATADPPAAKLNGVHRPAANLDLWLNASIVPAAGILPKLRAFIAAGRPGIVRWQERIAAVLAPASFQAPPSQTDSDQLPAYFASLNLPPLLVDLPLFEYPHDIVRHHMAILRENLEDRLAKADYREAAEGVFLADGVRLGPHLVTDTRQGPIVLEAGASIGAFCYLSGPAHVDRHAIEHASIKDGVAIGHTAKIGGEVEASIVEPYTNKQHHGFLGHSYLGSWINLGAGTCNSDLKNTYGPVNMEYHGRKVATGMQFIGCIMGDYAKTAINTGIFTGKTIALPDVLYGFVTTNVPSFVNYARSFGQVTELPVEVMVATQARMFARRNVTQRPCDVALLQAMYDLTQHERQLAGEPLAF